MVLNGDIIEILKKISLGVEINISVDVSTGEKDFDQRVFVDELIGFQEPNALLFTGQLNKKENE